MAKYVCFPPCHYTLVHVLTKCSEPQTGCSGPITATLGPFVAVHHFIYLIIIFFNLHNKYVTITTAIAL